MVEASLARWECPVELGTASVDSRPRRRPASSASPGRALTPRLESRAPHLSAAAGGVKGLKVEKGRSSYYPCSLVHHKGPRCPKPDLTPFNIRKPQSSAELHGSLTFNHCSHTIHTLDSTYPSESNRSLLERCRSLENHECEETTVTSSWEALGPFLLAVLLVSSAWTLALYLLRTWLAERLIQSTKHDFDLAIEQHKAELGKATDQYLALQSAAHSALIQGQRVSAEKRVQAAETTWRSVLDIRNKTATPLMMLDILNPSEYQLFVTKKGFRATVPNLEDLQVLETPDIEQSRPFLGDKLFAMVFVYRAIRGRICFLLDRDVQKGHVTPWFQDDGVKRLLQEVLSSEELEDFERLSKLRIRWVNNLLEQKILEDLRKVIDGTQSVDEGLEQARRILEAVRAVESDASERPEL